MNLLSERNQVRTVAERWKRQYPDLWRPAVAGKNGEPRRRGDILAELSGLDNDTATAADVAEIVGNSFWCCAMACHECGQSSWDVVELGEEPDWESSTVRICIDCLRKAVALVESAHAG